ncbi:MAG: hypothetical protein AAGF53_05870 [Pseudomonadota bacterium]
MIVAFGAILGASLGAFTAYRRKGNLADVLQYAFVYFLIFTMLAVFVNLGLQRIGV